MTDFPARGQKAPAYWDTQLKAYIDEADATKAPAAATTAALAGKADAAATTSALGTKANSSDVTAALADKADAAATSTALAGKEGTLSIPSQAEAEAGTSTVARKWTAQRVAQAIAALGGGGGGASDSGIYDWRYSGGSYPALPSTKPAWVTRVSAIGPVGPTTVPSWIGTTPDKVPLVYDYVPLT